MAKQRNRNYDHELLMDSSRILMDSLGILMKLLSSLWTLHGVVFRVMNLYSLRFNPPPAERLLCSGRGVQAVDPQSHTCFQCETKKRLARGFPSD